MYGLLYIIGATLAWILIAVTIIHVIMDNRQPAKSMAWALVIFFIPLVGIVFYSEKPTVQSLIGVIMVLAAVVLLNVRKSA